MGQPLPVIVSMGGVNGAGRSSMHHSTARMLEDVLNAPRRAAMLASLRQLMGSDAAADAEVLAGTLIRPLESHHFDPARVACNRRFPMRAQGHPLSFEIARKHLPHPLPAGWQLHPGAGQGQVRVQIGGEHEFLLPTHREFEVKAASQAPSGFDPSALYRSRHHPRGLALSIYAASDALGSLGLNWDELSARLPVDAISVYAGSAMGQLDDPGAGGMLKARYCGSRPTSKYCPFGLAQMPADFVNAYVLGAAGSTGATLGACASFLYNLRHAVHDIREGRARIAVVGAAEAPLTPEIMEGYAAMSALATDKELRELDGLGDDAAPDYRRACRPFGENCGFTMGESAQFLLLFDDQLAMETGASILGAAADVFVNADGYKKSISGPGVGNYLTVAKAAACARAIVGEKALRSGGIVHAHGTGTPQNRVTESAILSRVAGFFGIEDWPVAAIKAYVGHSLATASGDQIAAALGAWDLGWLPAIRTTAALAADVSCDHLSFALEHRALDPKSQRYALINAKGFGGNNATATLLSPEQTRAMLFARHGARARDAYWRAHEAVRSAQQAREARVLAGRDAPRYRFDYSVLGDESVAFTADTLRIGDARASLKLSNPFAD